MAKAAIVSSGLTRDALPDLPDGEWPDMVLKKIQELIDSHNLVLNNGITLDDNLRSFEVTLDISVPKGTNELPEGGGSYDSVNNKLVAPSGGILLPDNSTLSGAPASASTATPLMDGVGSAGTGSSGYACGNHVHPTDTSRAPLNSPTFTGSPAAPTQASSDNSNLLATTAFVKSVLPAYTATKAAATNTSSIAQNDTRSVNDAPQDRLQGLYVDFKSNGTDGLSDGGSFHGVITFRQWGSTSTDFSGGQSHQIAVTDNGHIWHRTSTSATAWSSWSRLFDSSLAGSGTIPAAGTVLTINNSQVTSSSKIMLTQTSTLGTASQIWVVAAAGSFAVHCDIAPGGAGISFNYAIVG